MPSLSKLDWPAILGNVIALWAGLLVLGTLAGRGAVWAMCVRRDGVSDASAAGGPPRAPGGR
jgi:hypothetical protein